MKKLIGVLICTLFFSINVIPVIGEPIQKETNSVDYSLPPPISIDMVLEKSICRRMSVRGFTGEQVTDEELSTILWAAYGYNDNDNRTIFNPDNTYSTVIYVIKSDATYKYVPEDNSLSLFKTGNYLYLGPYTAPIQIGLVWDKSVTSDELFGMSEIGMIGQNIYFDANALDLGTVTTAMVSTNLYELGLPPNEIPEIIMPLGHPSPSYDFTYNPLPASNLQSIVNNTYSLEDSINNRSIGNRWDNLPLSDVEESQLIWSSYGLSYLWDNVNHKRHYVLPSAMGKYPFKIYAANQDGVYQYNPSTHSITTIVEGDRREEINNSLGSNDIWAASASWIIIPFYNTGINPERIVWWYYEIGAITHNVILEATSLNLSSNIITDISDVNALRSALGISSQTNLQPWFVVPVGHPFTETPNNPPITPTITGPTSGKPGEEYTFCIPAITDPDGDNLFVYWDWGDGETSGWLGPYESGQEICANHSWDKDGTYIIKAKLKDEFGAESDWGTLKVSIPRNKALFNSILIKLIEIIQKIFPNISYI